MRAAPMTLRKFKIVNLIQNSRTSGDTPESDEYFFLRIESVAESYAKAGYKIISVSFPCETEARLFMEAEQ